MKLAIESLPDDFKQSDIMAGLEAKPYKEFAAVMGCPLGTVMSRLYRGRKLRRERLRGYAEERRR